GSDPGCWGRGAKGWGQTLAVGGVALRAGVRPWLFRAWRWGRRELLRRHGSCRCWRGRGIQQLLEQLALARDLDAVPPPLDEQPVERVDLGLDHHVRVLDRAAPRLPVDDARNLPADAELEGAGRRRRCEHRVESAV